MKVLIGCPTFERYSYCADLWLQRVKEIIEFSRTKGIEADYLLVDNSKTNVFFDKLKEKANIVKGAYSENVKERIVNSRNILRDKVLNEGYDYFLSLEQDMIAEKDVLFRLLSHNKEITSAYYGKLLDVVLKDNETGEIKNATIELPVIYLQVEGGIRQANPVEVLNKGLIKVGAFGVGCLLIGRKVIEKIKFRFEEGKAAYDDFLFCADAKREGYELFLDSDIRVEHLHKAWDESLLKKN